MTKDEIKKALEVCTDCYSTCKDCPYDGVWDCGDTLKSDVLGFIIEQEDEIEKDRRRAKIDVLKELKTRHDYAIKNMGYPWDISQQIDELIKELEDENKYIL